MHLDSRIWIPGSNGLVAKNLIEKLRTLGYRRVITTSRVELDVSDARSVDAFVEHNKIDVIFMTAAKVGGVCANMSDPYGFLFDNLKIETNIIDAAGKFGVKKLINLGSSCIYPKDYPMQPLKEEYLMQADLEPTNYGYALAKIAGVKLCEYANKKYPETHFISLMSANLYGPHDHMDSENSHALAALISRIYHAKKNGDKEITIYGNGKPQREWLYVGDLVDCVLWSIDNIPRDFHGFLNVGPGVDHSMIELTEMIAKQLDWDGKINLDESKPNGMMKKLLDVSKINALGWSTKTPLELGLRNTIEWYLKGK